MAEEVKAEEKAVEMALITIPHPDGDCVFEFPKEKEKEVLFLENAAYRLLTHFVYTRINVEIAKQREALKKEAEAEIDKKAEEAQ